MTPETAHLLIENLIERLDADAASERPHFRGIVSNAERTALRSLLKGRDTSAGTSQATTDPIQVPTGGPRPQHFAIELNKAALRLDSSPAPDWVLGLDFGTAKSKAFAATDEEEPELLPLAIGKADEDIDGAVHEMHSSLWIDDDGLLFMGSEAVKRGISYGDLNRRRLDSLKQQISQVHPEEGHTQLNRKLPEDIDPTSKLTYSDAIVCYLSYLTDLATTELELDPLVKTRYVRRRLTLPWWKREQRQWAAQMLTKSLRRAQLVADTFHGRWRKGIHVDQVKDVLQSAAKYDEQLTWMVLSEPADGVLEALAAASARVFTDGSARDLMLVVDVGAGTTDLSLFWVVQQADANGHSRQVKRAWPIEPCGTAIRQAGDTLDSLLVQELLLRGDLGADTALKHRVKNDLFSRVRRLKETLFLKGEVTVNLLNDHTVRLTEREFLDVSRVRDFGDGICDKIQGLLSRVHSSWEKAAGNSHITLVLAGGGCGLPMIRSLKDRLWTVGERRVTCRLARDLPVDLADGFSREFIREYPKLTVAMGGTLRTLLDEKSAMTEWHGGAAPAGGLEKFQMTGV